jgi:hypothetical protein
MLIVIASGIVTSDIKANDMWSCKSDTSQLKLFDTRKSTGEDTPADIATEPTEPVPLPPTRTGISYATDAESPV